MRNKIAPRTTRPPRVRTIALFTLLLVLANAIDVAGTLGAVANGAVELNPVMAWAFSFGPIGFVAMKTGMIVIFGAVLASCSRTHRLAWNGLRGVTVAYLAVAVWQLLNISCGHWLLIHI